MTSHDIPYCPLMAFKLLHEAKSCGALKISSSWIMKDFKSKPIFATRFLTVSGKYIPMMTAKTIQHLTGLLYHKCYFIASTPTQGIGVPKTRGRRGYALVGKHSSGHKTSENLPVK